MCGWEQFNREQEKACVEAVIEENIQRKPQSNKKLIQIAAQRMITEARIAGERLKLKVKEIKEREEWPIDGWTTKRKTENKK